MIILSTEKGTKPNMSALCYKQPLHGILLASETVNQVLLNVHNSFDFGIDSCELISSN